LISFISIKNNIVSFYPQAPARSQLEDMREFVRFNVFSARIERGEISNQNLVPNFQSNSTREEMVM
jgi:hypothetical protein